MSYGMSEVTQESQNIEAIDTPSDTVTHIHPDPMMDAMNEVLDELLSTEFRSYVPGTFDEEEESGNPTSLEMPTLISDIGEDEDHDLDTDIDDSELFGSDTDGEEILETPIHISEHTGFEETKTPDISPRALFVNGEEHESDDEEEEPMCSVCYNTLTIKSIVNTKCNHTFCTKCFYRWIEVNATCPQCRDPIDSHTTLTDEQIVRECTDLYTNYRTNLKDWSRNMKRNKRLITESCKLQIENIKIKQESLAYMERIVRLNNDIERNNAYNLGCIAAKNEIIYGHPMHHDKYALVMRPHFSDELPIAEHTFYSGYESGYYRFLNEYSELEKDNKEADKEAFVELSEKSYTEDIAKANIKFKKVMNIEVKRKVSIKHKQFIKKNRHRK